MNSYNQVHDFTAQGHQKFKQFMAKNAKDTVNTDMAKLECLGVLEDNLNGTENRPLTWQLDIFSSDTGYAEIFSVEESDLIIETVFPEE